MSKFEAFEKQCKEYIASHSSQSLEEIYILIPNHSAPADPSSLNRLGGPPLGVDEGSWPRYAQMARIVAQSRWDGDEPFDGDTRMEHVFTLDLRQTPTLRRGLPDEVIAMSMFISSTRMNEAYNSGNDQTAVVFLTQEHLDAGYFEAPLPKRLAGAAAGFQVHPVMVPSAIFFTSNEDAALQELHRMLFNLPAYAGGQEIWLQGDAFEDEFGFDDYDDYGGEDEDDEDGGHDERAVVSAPIPASQTPALLRLSTGFLLQFSESFAYMNLGDSGQMYVYGGDAFWQCY